MLKDRQSHRIGRIPNVHTSGESSTNVWYSNSANFSEDENRESGFR